LVLCRADAATVPGAEHYLRQVVNNLLDNAIKFTPAGGRVEVRVEAAAGRAVLRVADTGAGIPPEDLSRIFERFYQVDKARGRENSRRGTGLGLSICAAIVAALRGEIEVASTPGRGSTFAVFLPLDPAGAALPESPCPA
jgi:two-component system phosphate regulon sensor histidine kinase PhoR